jgi:zinc transporter ZupT
MPLSSYEHLPHPGGDFNHLLYGIVLHKAPAAFALVILLIQSRFSRSFIVVSLIIFASMSPIGAFLAQKLIVDPATINKIMALVVGSFLHISTTILFEADSTHQHLISWRKLIAIIAGFGFAILTIM